MVLIFFLFSKFYNIYQFSFFPTPTAKAVTTSDRCRQKIRHLIVSESKQHKLQERACKGYFECYGERWIQQPEREKKCLPKNITLCTNHQRCAHIQISPLCIVSVEEDEVTSIIWVGQQPTRKGKKKKQ